MDLPPVDEYVSIEVWQYSSGEIGWRMASHEENQLNSQLVEDMLCEMVDSFIETVNDDKVLYTILAKNSGETTTRWMHDIEGSTRSRYVWVKTNLYRSFWNMQGYAKTPGRLLEILWSLEYYFNRAKGHLDACQKPAAAGATSLPAHPQEVVFEPSEAVSGASEQPLGRLLHFPLGGRK